MKIAHLSDLHLGNDFVVRSLASGRPWWRAEDVAIQEALADCLFELKPEYLVISGDIVNKCYEGSFRHAASAIRKLCQRAKIDVGSQLLVVPGNHDVKVIPEESKYFARLQLFVEFLKELFDEDNYRTRTERFIRVDYQSKVCFLCLDTTLKNAQPIAEGIVGKAQWRWARKKLAELNSSYPEFRRFVKIVVLHHHPYQIQGDANNRFMQLEDAAEADRFFDEFGIQVVLHGHKHFPHITPKSHSSGRHTTVIGAGTACCPTLSEQATMGNSFNLIELEPSANILIARRFKLQPDNQFREERSEKTPLFQPSGKGYKMRLYRTHFRIKDADGNCEILDQRQGLAADSPAGNGVMNIRFQLHSLPADAKIERFDWSGAVQRIDFETPPELRHREMRGAFVLERALSWGGATVDFSSTAHLSKGFQMTSNENQKFEEASIVIEHPSDKLKITVDFPDRFPVRPEVHFINQRRETVEPTDVSYEVLSDSFTNTHTLTVNAPSLDHFYGLRWRLP